MSGNHTATLPRSAHNTSLEFLNDVEVKQGHGIAANCDITAVSGRGILNCIDQENTQLYVCGDGALSLGTAIPEGCRAITLRYEPVREIPDASSVYSVAAG